MERPVNLNTARVFVRDIEEAKNFYSGAFGLSITAGSSKHGYFIFDAGATTLVVELADGEDRDLVGRFTGLSFDVPDAYASYEELRPKGVTFNETPERQPWGGVTATLVDPSGNALQICEQPRA